MNQRTGRYSQYGLMVAATLALVLSSLWGMTSGGKQVRPATAGTPCRSSQAGALARESISAWVLRRQVTEVSVMFTATKGGKYATDLRQQDVKVSDDNRPAAQIADFRSEQNLPLRLALLIDTSGSVKNRFPYETEAAARFVNGLADPRSDQVFVAGFSHQMQVVQDFTSDLHKVGSALQQLHDDQRDTALFDAVADACQKLAASGQQPKVARVLVVISDGDDNASKYALKDAARIAEWDEVTIYTIIGSARWGTNPAGDRALRRLAQESGGIALYSISRKQIGRAFTRIQNDLRNRYEISYRPASFQADGHFRPIHIEAKQMGSKLHVRARKGYYARPFSSPGDCF